MSQNVITLEFSLVRDCKLINLLEELINFQPQVNIEFTNKGLSISTMDSLSTVLVNIFYSKDDFKIYKLEGKNNIVLGLDLRELIKIMKCSKPLNLINFKYTSRTTNILFINSKPSNELLIEHKMYLLDIVNVPVKAKIIDYTVTVTYDLKVLYKNMNKLVTKLVKYDFIAILNNDKFKILMKGDNKNSHAFNFSQDNYIIDNDILIEDNPVDDEGIQIILLKLINKTLN